MCVHEWWVKKEILPLFDGMPRQKKLEVRIKTPFVDAVRAGDTILFNKRVHRRVVDIHTYASFAEMLSAEDPQDIIPGATAEELLRLIQTIYTPVQEKLGVVVLELASEAAS